MDNRSILKVVVILTGVISILLFFGHFLQTNSSLDLLYISIGMMVFVFGIYTGGDEFLNETTSYFLAMFCINMFQWLILIYSLFFSRYVTGDIIAWIIVPLFTVSLIYRLHKGGLKYLKKDQKTNKGSLLINKIKLVFKDIKQFIIISAGFLIMIICLGSFLFSRSPVELYTGSVGMMIIVYGFFREDVKVKVAPPKYSPGMSRDFIYHDVKKVKVTIPYFFIMFSVILSQWLILYYFLVIYPSYVSQEVFRANLEYISWGFVITFFSTQYFYIQIRESHLIRITWQGTYIGKRKIL